MELVMEVYKATKMFPREEIFGLTSQKRRAVVSIPSNIAEGYGRLHQRETENFLSIALGSACELETQLILSKDLGYISLDEVEQLTIEVQNIIKMLAALIKALGKYPVNSSTCLLVN